MRGRGNCPSDLPNDVIVLVYWQEAEQQLLQVTAHVMTLQPELGEYALLELPRQPLALSALTSALCSKQKLSACEHPAIKASLSHAAWLLERSRHHQMWVCIGQEPLNSISRQSCIIQSSLPPDIKSAAGSVLEPPTDLH